MPTLVKVQRLKEPVQTVEAFLTDINAYGMGILSPVSFAQAEIVHLEFPRAALPLYTTSVPPRGNMEITGQIAHVAPLGERFRIGISFLKIGELDQILLKNLMPRHRALAPVPERRRAPRIPLLEEPIAPEPE